MATKNPMPVEPKRCGAVRYVGAMRFSCVAEPDHRGIHMAPGDSGDGGTSNGERGPFLVSWPSANLARAVAAERPVRT